MNKQKTIDHVSIRDQERINSIVVECIWIDMFHSLDAEIGLPNNVVDSMCAAAKTAAMEVYVKEMR
jgi:hypothetical protein